MSGRVQNLAGDLVSYSAVHRAMHTPLDISTVLRSRPQLCPTAMLLRRLIHSPSLRCLPSALFVIPGYDDGVPNSRPLLTVTAMTLAGLDPMPVPRSIAQEDM